MVEIIPIPITRQYTIPISRDGDTDMEIFLKAGKKICTQANKESIALHGVKVLKLGTYTMRVEITGTAPLSHCERCKHPIRPAAIPCDLMPGTHREGTHISHCTKCSRHIDTERTRRIRKAKETQP